MNRRRSSGLFQVGANDTDEILGQLSSRNRALLVTHHMQPDVIFEDLCHQAVDSASDVGEQHQHVGAVASRGERAFDGIDLAADALNASYKFAAKRASNSGGTGLFRGTDYGTYIIQLVLTSKDLGGRPPLASCCISFSWLFFHGGNTGSNPVGTPDQGFRKNVAFSTNIPADAA
jgi:hypothetical protein